MQPRSIDGFSTPISYTPSPGPNTTQENAFMNMERSNNDFVRSSSRPNMPRRSDYDEQYFNALPSDFGATRNYSTYGAGERAWNRGDRYREGPIYGN